VPSVTGKCEEQTTDGGKTWKQGCNDDVAYYRGPLQIRWVRPSVSGSSMPDFQSIGPQQQLQLANFADNAVTLRYKAEFAINHGDLAAAERYLWAANQKDPGNADIRADIVKLRGLKAPGYYDQHTQTLAGIPHFERPQVEVLAPLPPGTFEKFKNDPNVQALRHREMAAYQDVVLANTSYEKTKSAAAGGTATPQQLDSAKAGLDQAAGDFQKAQTDLKKYVLDPQ
jgi:hypothetical protein